MAGIYFHIPYCKSKCNYCKFYSVTDLIRIDQLVSCEIQELLIRREYIGNDVVNSIYFGGGTPSLLSINQVNIILLAIRKNFLLSDGCEITFEANPEDLTEEYLYGLYKAGINRLSIGIQSFNNKVLKFIGRRHDNSKLAFVVENAKKAGFNNISVDLIFGIPGVLFETYLESLLSVLQLGVKHISSYLLAIEKNTYFYKRLKGNYLTDISDDEMLNQFNTTIDILKDNGFIQYEISNYALKGFISIHNSSYWEDEIYLGIGPSSHSYNRVSRQWNIKNISKYCHNISSFQSCFEIEFLTENDRYNEYVIKGLRTSIGISNNYIENNFNINIANYFINNLSKLINFGLINCIGDKVTLTRKGIFMCDFVVRELYYVSN
jgi:oxygen-independent coproporphyrinogen-3 oxidase